jgi:hypothetical protein
LTNLSNIDLSIVLMLLWNEKYCFTDVVNHDARCHVTFCDVFLPKGIKLFIVKTSWMTDVCFQEEKKWTIKFGDTIF